MIKKHVFKTVIGDDTEVKVSFTFYPGRPAKLYGDDPHPEELPEIDICAVTVNGDDIVNVLNEECLRQLKDDAEKYLTNYNYLGE